MLVGFALDFTLQFIVCIRIRIPDNSLPLTDLHIGYGFSDLPTYYTGTLFNIISILLDIREYSN